MSITDFVKTGHSKEAKFQKKLKQCTSKEEERELEKHFLKPETIPPYTGPKPPLSATKPLTVRTVKIVFPDNYSAELVKKHFPISTHVEPCLSNTKLLILFCEALENGSLIYDKAKNKVRPSEK